MLYLKSLAIDDCPELSRRGRCVPLNDGIVREKKHLPVNSRSDRGFRLQIGLPLLAPIVVVGSVVDEMLAVPNIETPYLLRQRRSQEEFGRDPSAAQPRDPKTVEGYIQ